MPFSKRIFVLGPGLKENKCTAATPDCLEKHDVMLIGDGKRRIGVDQLPEDLGEDPAIYLKIDTIHFGFEDSYFNPAPLVTSLKTMDDFYEESRSKTLVSQTDFFRDLAQRLGPTSRATIILETCRFSRKAQKEIKKFLPAGVTLVSTSNDIGLLSMSSLSTDYIGELLSASTDEIVARTITGYGNGAALISRGRKIISAKAPETLPSRALVKEHLRREFERFRLDPSGITDKSVDQYALGLVIEKVVNKQLKEEFIKSVAASDINFGAVFAPIADTIFRGLLGGKFQDYPLVGELLDAMRGKFEATIDAPIPLFGEPSLFEATRTNDVGLMRELIAAGANPNVKSSEGITPLIAAVELGHEEALDLLLNTPGVNVDETLPDGYDALFVAVVMERYSMVKRILQAGATRNLEFAFASAVKMSNKAEAKELIKLCLDNGLRPKNLSAKFKFQKLVDKHLAKIAKAAESPRHSETNTELVVGARGDTAAEAPEYPAAGAGRELPRSPTALLPTTAAAPASVSAAAPTGPTKTIAAAAPVSAAPPLHRAAPELPAPAPTKSRSGTTSALQPSAVPSQVKSSLGLAAASSILAVAHAFIDSKYPLTPSPSPTSLIDLDAPLPDLSMIPTPEILHQTDEERKFAHEEKLERAAQKAEVRDRQPSSKPNHPSSRPAKGKSGKQGRR